MTLEQSEYLAIKEKSVLGRYVVNKNIEGFLEKIKGKFEVKMVGKSVLGLPIRSIVIGTGPIKILMWSQMHGNESTTTKAVLDLINYLDSDLPKTQTILKSCTITIIPILNPDGAAAYTRVNANAVDLNRDAQQRTQPESRALRNVFDGFQPDYCFNLHDQRTIFNVGDASKPATISFLAPAHDEIRSVSPTRSVSMKLIVAMNMMVQKQIPGQVGRYDDTFNANCVGDAFQMTDTPTVLFEAGHYADDYDRERTREYIFQALRTALHVISDDKVSEVNPSDYFLIPENQKRYYDILIRNAHIIAPSLKKGDAIGILYVETLNCGAIDFVPKIDKTGSLDGYYGHKTYNCLIDSELKALKGHSTFAKLLSTF
ncbi:M14 metallopeptidase family protein [Pricia sp.]|uniref:M14 family metallopeptidase n=1 Tax=Pricia sp. TaxID=2268138 RepID=UPI0035932E3A